mmetsp:Transcript_11368/g.42164  ORF Transcript_11368/g.42164 Transcript_11368/m.42164 type:complete len:247 (-) Transcript_11368:615-1355(-)
MRRMVFGDMFCIIFAVCWACSSDMVMPLAADISFNCSGLMFFIMSLIALCIAGSFIFSAILLIMSSEGPPTPIPDAGSIPMSFISAAIFIMPCIASGFMFFIIEAACLAILGSILGIPAPPPGMFFVIAANCSSVMFSIIADALDMNSGSFIASVALAMASGGRPMELAMEFAMSLPAPPVTDPDTDSSKGGVSPSSVSPLATKSLTALSSSAFTVSSPGDKATARRKSPTANRKSPLNANACPLR